MLLKVSHKIFLLTILLSFSSVLSTVQAQNQQKNQTGFFHDLTQLSKKLGVEIAENSPHLALYKEAAKWLGTRYRRGGSSAKGVDCSGFTGIIYNVVFNQSLSRRSADIAKEVSFDVNKKDLKTGDLVFFATSGNKKGINHVGVYLKDNLFVHASCSNGVIVSNLDEPYYKRTWRKGGRIEKKDEEKFRSQFLPKQALSVVIPTLNVSSELPNISDLNLFGSSKK